MKYTYVCSEDAQKIFDNSNPVGKEIIRRYFPDDIKENKPFEDFDPNKYYGINSDGTHALITQCQFDSNEFIVVVTDSFSAGNSFVTLSGCVSWNDIIDFCKKNTNFLVSFDSWYDLAKWSIS